MGDTIEKTWRMASHLAACVAALLTQTACETNADDIDTSGGSAINVMTCLFRPSDTITVHLSASVPYDSELTEAAVGNAYVDLGVNGEPVWTLHLTEGQTSATFPTQRLTATDSITITADIDGSANPLRATARVMSVIPIEKIDTATSADKMSLRINVIMTDPQETADYYQITAHLVSYKDGAMTDTTLQCEYESSVFRDLSDDISQSASIGLFNDERLLRNADNQSSLRLTASWADLSAPPGVGADSIFLAVRLHHLHEDLYNFLYSCQQARKYILLPVFGTTSVTSNVDGGNGIVACVVYDERRFLIGNP